MGGAADRPGAPRWLRYWVGTALLVALLAAGARVLTADRAVPPPAAPSGPQGLIGTAWSDTRVIYSPTS
ncbi:hypothetical protein ACIB24_14235 [Spongisporangium articulatum]|uniref:Class F sortase n=1 Tax=Spongisporangium articulatum TaxID=3362603 RepID=A0ABW8APB6_9ACTN